MKKSEHVIWISVIIILIIVTSVFLINNINENSSRPLIKDQNEIPEKINGPLIGGQRDENGCLVPAGYSYNQDIQACLKTWELNQEEKQAAKIAIEHLDPYYSLTITQIDQLKCPGCFNLYLTDENLEDKLVNIIDWEVTFDSKLNKEKNILP